MLLEGHQRALANEFNPRLSQKWEKFLQSSSGNCTLNKINTENWQVSTEEVNTEQDSPESTGLTGYKVMWQSHCNRRQGTAQKVSQHLERKEGISSLRMPDHSCSGKHQVPTASTRGGLHFACYGVELLLASSFQYLTLGLGWRGRGRKSIHGQGWGPLH